MRHEVKTEPIIKLELTLEEFEYIFSASSVSDTAHEELHGNVIGKEYNEKLSQDIADQLNEIYNSIK